MTFRPWLRLTLCLGLALSTPIVPTVRAQSAQSPPAPTIQSPGSAVSARVQLRGLPNFGMVSDRLYRGGQPENPGFAELRNLGVDIVVNLRHETDRIVRERTLVEGLGMRYVSIPWQGKDDPSTEQVAQFLELLRDNPDRRVFVHCRRGAERTGVFVASYRIAREHWTPEQALAEMEVFGFRGLRFGHLKRFVREYPTHAQGASHERQ
jgi:protein tyrosine/serine phosphatase